MELEDYYEKSRRKNMTDTARPPPAYDQIEGRAQKSRNRCFVLITVCLGILCLVITGAVIVWHFYTPSKQGFLWGPEGLFMSDEDLSWSEIRQFCRDRGADLVMIKTEEKQRHISSFVKEIVWIGLTDEKTEGSMKWVDNSPLEKGFWFPGEPNNYRGIKENCVALHPSNDVLRNWYDTKCMNKLKGICEKQGN